MNKPWPKRGLGGATDSKRWRFWRLGGVVNGNLGISHPRERQALGRVTRLSGQAVRNKLPRGTFSAAFFLAAIASMKASRVTRCGSGLAKLKVNEEANSVAEKLADVEAAVQEKADAEKRKLQLETIRKAGIRSDLPAEINGIVAKMKKEKGKKSLRRQRIC